MIVVVAITVVKLPGVATQPLPEILWDFAKHEKVTWQ